MSSPGFDKAALGVNESRTRYPSPFFDVGQMYTPLTLKEAFKFIHFFAGSNSFLGPSIDKISRYPITDPVIEDKNPANAKFWQTLIVDQLKIKSFNMDVNKDLNTFGNAIIGIHYPFTRFLQCRSCKHTEQWKNAKKEAKDGKIKLHCKKCTTAGEAVIKDVPLKDKSKINLLRFDIRSIDIKYNETSGCSTYTYSVSEKMKKQVMSGDLDIIETTHKIFLDAISKRKKIRLSSDHIYHLKHPTLCTNDMGWGWPRLMAGLRDLYYFYTLRKGQEAIINEYIVPFDILYPNGNGKFDPTSGTDISKWKKQIKEELAQKRKDPAYKAIMPFPVGVERIGGDGKSLMLTAEQDFLAKVIVGTVGITQEFVYGGTMNWSGSSVSLRTLENDFLHNRNQIVDMNRWIVRRLSLFFKKAAPQQYSMTDFKMADDLQRQQTLINMARERRFPWELIYKDLNYDPAMIKTKLENEVEFFSSIQERENLAAAKTQAQSQVFLQKYQARQQMQAAEAQKVKEDPSVAVWGERIAQMNPAQQNQFLTTLEETVGSEYVEKLKAFLTGSPNPIGGHFTQQQEQQVDMNQQIDPNAQTNEQKNQNQPQKDQQSQGADNRPLPEQRPPRRAGGI